MLEFDGITFEDMNGLIEFLKHSYFAQKSRIWALERTIQEVKSPGAATARRLDRLWRKLADELEELAD
jgi:hypothetical protein